MPDGDGGLVDRPWNVVGPALRRRLFRETAAGLEPVSVWLNEDGLPRDPHGWHHTFEGANARIAALGVDEFHVVHRTCCGILLRCGGFRWACWSTRPGWRTLSEDEARDFRTQFGDTWHLVQTMLGHRHVETTKNVYLEPFRGLSVEVLLAHADGFPVAESHGAGVRFASDGGHRSAGVAGEPPWPHRRDTAVRGLRRFMGCWPAGLSSAAIPKPDRRVRDFDFGRPTG